MSKTLRLTVIANSASDTELAAIKNTLASAIACLGQGWELAPSTKANLAFVWINSAADANAFQILREKFPLERVIVAANSEFSELSVWALTFAKQHTMPSILSIANLLSRVQAHFEPEGQTVEPATFNPADYFYGIVQQALEDKIARICKHPACPDVYLLPSENAFYLNTPIDQLAPLALTKREAISVTEVDGQQVLETVSYVKFSSRLSSYLSLDEDSLFNDINVKKYKRFSINELVWFAVLMASQGRLLDGGLHATPVLLKQLPEYLRLDYYGKEFKAIADCMNANALTLAETSAKTERSWFEVAGFYNACSVMELIETGAAAARIVASKAAARDTLENMFAKIGQNLATGRIKIVVAGSVGSGKTTAIATLSDFSPITTETRPSDTVTRKKSTTTVAMDYGEIRFNGHLKVFLYGTPGQRRFDFMSQLLCQNAWGMLLLIDNTEQDPIGELAYYLNLFEKFIDKIQLAIGITHCDETDDSDLGKYLEYLNQQGLSFPVMQVDAREPSSLTHLLACLVEKT